jgi:hypothetical protein
MRYASRAALRQPASRIGRDGGKEVRMHANPALYAKGPYRVVADIGDEADRRFLVIDTAGTRLREEASFAGACGWVDRRVDEIEAAMPARARAPSR